VHELDAGQRALGRIERLEAQRGTSCPLHSPMVLLDHVVEILHLAVYDGSAMLVVVTPDGRGVGLTAIDGDRLRHPVTTNGLGQEAQGLSVLKNPSLLKSLAFPSLTFPSFTSTLDGRTFTPVETPWGIFEDVARRLRLTRLYRLAIPVRRLAAPGTLSTTASARRLQADGSSPTAPPHGSPVLAVALNVVRLSEWWLGMPLAKTRCSPFATLRMAAA
jgi:hypothetical protein